MEKSDDEKMLDLMARSQELEHIYNEMSKEDLVNMMVFKDMMNESFDDEAGEVGLWCYVANKTGLKYLTDELPEKYFLNDPDGIFMTNGEIDIRVPQKIESLFPDIKYGDEPVLVKLSVSF